MISYPNSKINIGLNILSKLKNGYHNIESVFYPVLDNPDILEIIPNKKFSFTSSGLKIQGNDTSNLCVKAFNLLKEKYKIPPVTIHLHKQIPMGAGMGGGSSNGAFTLKMINQLFSLNLSTERLKKLAAKLGSDCPFFIENKPSYVSGTGNIITPIPLDLSDYKIKIITSTIHIDTKTAYSLITPQNKKSFNLKKINTLTVDKWKDLVNNDFELPIFKLHKELEVTKKKLYQEGARYVSLTGSGSAIYSIF